jgi:hypothetical protein
MHQATQIKKVTCRQNKKAPPDNQHDARTET